jgi:hypothetical protein
MVGDSLGTAESLGLVSFEKVLGEDESGCFVYEAMYEAGTSSYVIRLDPSALRQYAEQQALGDSSSSDDGGSSDDEDSTSEVRARTAVHAQQAHAGRIFV